MRQLTYALFVGFTLTAAFVGFAHEGHSHHPGAESKTPMTHQESATYIEVIRADYQRRIEPIFRKSCMDCHSSQTRFPWYHGIPGVKQLIDADITKARHHLDFSSGYPFKSHASLMEDLDAIAKSVENGTMPPTLYRVMHTKESMTKGEQETVLDWITKSKTLLEKRPEMSSVAND